MAEIRTTEIRIPYPDAAELHLKLAVGACRLRVRPSESDVWVSGNYQGPADALPLKIDQSGGVVTISQQKEVWGLSGLLSRDVPTFDLALGKARPFALTLETGASEGIFDLGNVPISRIAAKHGAGKLEMDFSAPNPQALDTLELASGAGAMTIRNLGNANFADLKIEGGAATYKFDFGGKFRRDASARITTGVSSIEITVPGSTAAKIVTETVMGSLDLGDGFMKKDGAFWTEAALAGATPVLSIRASVTLGSMKLRAV
jgi:hypothetical protein